VHFHHDWVAHGERDLWLSSAVIGVSAHRRHLETEFSFRTRIVDYLWCGLPVVTTEGDELGDLVVARGAGRSVPEGDDEAFAVAMAALLDDPVLHGRARTAALGTAREYSWDSAAAPLVAFCAEPRRAPDLRLGPADRELLGIRGELRRGSLQARIGAARREGGIGLVLRRLGRRLTAGRAWDSRSAGPPHRGRQRRDG
jgi:hypothetical protein